MRIGVSELILIVVLILLLFGGSKIPGIMKSFGEGIKLFKKEVSSNEHSNKKVKSAVKVSSRQKKHK